MKIYQNRVINHPKFTQNDQIKIIIIIIIAAADHLTIIIIIAVAVEKGEL
jgi:hypothetical protein